MESANVDESTAVLTMIVRADDERSASSTRLPSAPALDRRPVGAAVLSTTVVYQDARDGGVDHRRRGVDGKPAWV